MMKKLLLPLVLATFLAACTQETPQTATPDPIKESVGCYSGTIPAADAAGIDVKIVLKEDKTYERTSIYQERNDKFDETGTWSIDDKKMIVLSPKDGSAYPMQWENEKIVFLMPDGKKIEGELAGQYILNRCTPK